MSQVEQVLREGMPSIISVNGKGHLDAEKIVHFRKCTLWGEYYQDQEYAIHNIIVVVQSSVWKPRRAISFDSATRNPHPASRKDAGCGAPHPASRKVNFYIILCECPTITYGG